VSTLHSVDDKMSNECGAVSGIIIDEGNISTRSKPATVTVGPPQIPHDLS
jgi:hypothetical protein